MTELEALVEDVRRRLAPEPRTAVFEIRVDARDGGYAFTGVTTEPAAAEELLRRATSLGRIRVADEILRLPDPALGTARWAVVRAGVAPVLAAPDIRATQVSQYVLGTLVELLLPAGRWVRVRGEDGYLGWMHRGYLAAGDRDWAHGWAEAAGARPVVSLGAELAGPRGRPLVRLPWGARIGLDARGRCRLPDGRSGTLVTGELVPLGELPVRFPPRGGAAVRSARHWIGAPYLWGGVTFGGVDCSGFVQAVLRLHGILLPRDAELQVAVGRPVLVGDDFVALRPGDLLFFTEVPGRITHVALSMGGPRVVHASLANGGVTRNDLLGGGELQDALRRMFVQARRVLPD